MKCNLTLIINDKELGSILSASHSLGICEHPGWSGSRPVALWCFLVLGYFTGHFAITGSSLEGAMSAHACSFTLFSIQGIFV